MFCCADLCRNRETDRESHAEYCEEKMFAEIGMHRPSDYSIEDTPLLFPDGRTGHLHTIECGDPSSQPLVLIHGYGSGAVFFFKLMRELRGRFRIYAIDLYGMGSSTRPTLEDLDYSGVVEFLLEPLELWRKQKNITSFVLAGFSMGGYVAALWLKVKRPPVVCAYLLSPAGFTNKSEEEIHSSGGFTDKVFHQLYKTYIHDKKINPFGMVPFRNMVLKKSCDSSLTGFTKEEVKWATKYLISIFDKNESGERVLGVLLRYLKYSSRPICDFAKDMVDDAKSHKNSYLVPPVKVLFGDKDLMDFAHAIEENRRCSSPVDIEMVPDCDHQLIHRHCEKISSVILRDYHQGYNTVHTDFWLKRGLNVGSD